MFVSPLENLRIQNIQANQLTTPAYLSKQYMDAASESKTFSRGPLIFDEPQRKDLEHTFGSRYTISSVEPPTQWSYPRKSIVHASCCRSLECKKYQKKCVKIHSVHVSCPSYPCTTTAVGSSGGSIITSLQNQQHN